MLSIRAYADEMLDGLDSLDKWPDTVKEAQRGWIGRTQGCEFKFEVNGLSDETLWLFTNQPEAILDTTYIAISPENTSLIEQLVKDNDFLQQQVEDYQAELDEKRRNGINLMEVNINKIEKGFELTGVKIKLPLLGNRELPVYIATYVLADQG